DPAEALRHFQSARACPGREHPTIVDAIEGFYRGAALLASNDSKAAEAGYRDCIRAAPVTDTIALSARAYLELGRNYARSVPDDPAADTDSFRRPTLFFYKCLEHAPR